MKGHVKRVHSMRLLPVIILISIIATHAVSQGQPSVNGSTPVLGTRVSLIPPAGFRTASQFPGFEDEALGASIMVIEFPASFLEVSSTFTNAGALFQKGMSFVSKEEVRLKDRSGALVRVTQSASGIDYVKQLLIMGDAQKAVLIVATFPQRLERQLGEKMKASLLTVSWDAGRDLSATDGLSYTFREPAELKVSKRMLNVLAFTRSGMFPSKDVNDPLFIIGQSLARVSPSDTEAFAKSRILQTASVKNIELEQSTKLNIDNLDGYEITAKALDTESGQPMSIYQVILFEEGNYYLMQGLISDSQSEKYMPIFRDLARSFKRKNR